MKFEDKPYYQINDNLTINEKKCVIIDLEDDRDMSNPFRPDYKDGTIYEVKFENGSLMSGLHWWNFDEGKKLKEEKANHVIRAKNMKIEKTTNVIKYLITETALDPITVIVENYNVGAGKIIIECYGKSWSTFWGAMGNINLEDFFISCNDSYLADRLYGSNDMYEYDIDKINEKAINLGLEELSKEDLVNEINSSTSYILEQLYGIEWWSDVPQKHKDDYEYLTKIIQIIKQAFKHIIEMRFK